MEVRLLTESAQQKKARTACKSCSSCGVLNIPNVAAAEMLVVLVSTIVDFGCSVGSAGGSSCILLKKNEDPPPPATTLLTNKKRLAGPSVRAEEQEMGPSPGSYL